MPARTHGEGHPNHPSRTYRSWNMMKQRCLNPNDPRYADYGGRGIKICTQWINSFIKFKEDMGARPLGTSLDRWPNTNGDYAPGNCRWATPKEQQRNMRTNRYLEFNGERKLLSDWAKELGVTYELLRSRVRRGWSIERAMTEREHKYEDVGGRGVRRMKIHNWNFVMRRMLEVR